ncbi:MAG: nucleotidyl transferase AbiEii/AbiGii toxin family protein, partial [Saprospiraceae bacterium]
TLIFKGGTCLRKCYFPDYRFSEDLDFTSRHSDFILDQKELNDVLTEVSQHTGIKFSVEEIENVKFKNKHMGWQVYIKYWGANHDRNQAPLPPERWTTRIKLEISTEELLVCETASRSIHHQYSDALISTDPILSYSLDEVVAEKLRSLVQRSYTAPRDFYDLYFLTNDFKGADWERMKPIFIQKMNHKGIKYEDPEQLIDDITTEKAIKAWQSSLAHQITGKDLHSPAELVSEVRKRITTYL